jgi:hypothetical protein
VSTHPLAPVIPSPRAPPSWQRAGQAAARRLPLASPAPVPSPPEDAVYGIARVDASGRVCERAVITALGWTGGDRLTFTADAGVVTARRDPGGMVTLPARGYLTIPGRAAPPLRPGGRRPGPAGRASRPGQPRRFLSRRGDQAIRAHGSFQHVQGGSLPGKRSGCAVRA